MSDAERCERVRLRAERWRRAHGIMPGRPAQRPWLRKASRARPWYLRRKQSRERAALAALNNTCTRAEAFICQLQAKLAMVARFQALEMAVIDELAEFTPIPWRNATPTPHRLFRKSTVFFRLSLAMRLQAIDLTHMLRQG
jgi:hypothetical protein